MLMGYEEFILAVMVYIHENWHIHLWWRMVNDLDY